MDNSVTCSADDADPTVVVVTTFVSGEDGVLTVSVTVVDSVVCSASSIVVNSTVDVNAMVASELTVDFVSVVCLAVVASVVSSSEIAVD